MATSPKNYYISRLQDDESTHTSSNMMNTPKTITKNNNNNNTMHGWTAEKYMKLVDSCTYTDPTSKVDKLIGGYERLTRLDNPVNEGTPTYSGRDPRMKPKYEKTFSTPQKARHAYMARKAKETRTQDFYKPPTMVIPTDVPVVATPASAVNNHLTKTFSEDTLLNMPISELKVHLFGPEDPEDTVPTTEKIPPPDLN